MRTSEISDTMLDMMIEIFTSRTYFNSLSIGRARTLFCLFSVVVFIKESGASPAEAIKAATKACGDSQLGSNLFQSSKTTQAIELEMSNIGVKLGTAGSNDLSMWILAGILAIVANLKGGVRKEKVNDIRSMIEALPDQFTKSLSLARLNKLTKWSI